MGQNWRMTGESGTSAEDYFGQQKRQAAIENRKPVVRQSSDLVGPGIAASAVAVDDWNDVLATFNGYYSSTATAANTPNDDENFTGVVVSDASYGGTQTLTGMTSGTQYSRVFVRNPADPATIGFSNWAQASAAASIVRLNDFPTDLLTNTWTPVALRNPTVRGTVVESPANGIIRIKRDGWYEVGAQCRFITAADRSLMRVITGTDPGRDIEIAEESPAVPASQIALNASTKNYYLAGTVFRMYLYSNSPTGTSTDLKYLYVTEC